MKDETFIKELEDYFFEGEPMKEAAKKKVIALLETYGNEIKSVPRIIREKIYFKKLVEQLSVFRPEERKVTVEDIFQITIQVTGISREAIVGRCRKRMYVNARHVCLFFICNHFPEIGLKGAGEYFDSIDHTSVIYAKLHVRNMVEIGDAYFVHYVREIEKEITSINEKRKLKAV